MWGWVTHNLKSRLPGEISTISDMQIYHSNGIKQRRTKEPSPVVAPRLLPEVASGCGAWAVLSPVAAPRLLPEVASGCGPWAIVVRASVLAAHGLSSCS